MHPGINPGTEPLGIPFAITPLVQLHQSPPSQIPGDPGRGPTHHQSHVLEHRDTYGQTQVWSDCLPFFFPFPPISLLHMGAQSEFF